MRLSYIKYLPKFKRYAWLVITDDNKHHLFKYKVEAEKFFTNGKGNSYV